MALKDVLRKLGKSASHITTRELEHEMWAMTLTVGLSQQDANKASTLADACKYQEVADEGREEVARLERKRVSRKDSLWVFRRPSHLYKPHPSFGIEQEWTEEKFK